MTPAKKEVRASADARTTKMNSSSEPIAHRRLQFKLVRVEDVLRPKQWERLRRRCLWQPRRRAA
jgi:hypothetical protein